MTTNTKMIDIIMIDKKGAELCKYRTSYNVAITLMLYMQNQIGILVKPMKRPEEYFYDYAIGDYEQSLLISTEQLDDLTKEYIRMNPKKNSLYLLKTTIKNAKERNRYELNRLTDKSDTVLIFKKDLDCNSRTWWARYSVRQFRDFIVYLMANYNLCKESAYMLYKIGKTIHEVTIGKEQLGEDLIKTLVYIYGKKSTNEMFDLMFDDFRKACNAKNNR